MENTKTLYRIDFFNRKSCQTETKYTPAYTFKEAYETAEYLLHNHSEFTTIKQIAELHPVTLVTPSTYGNNTDKQPSDTL